jgi:hypothetical protein
MYEWEFATKRPKSPLWYIIAASVALALVVWGFFIGLYAMSVVVVLFAGVYLLYENNFSDTTRVIFSDNDIRVGNERYEYARVLRFGVVSLAGQPIFLRFFVKGTLGSTLDIPVPDQGEMLAEIREYLATKLPQDETMAFSDTEKILYRLGV